MNRSASLARLADERFDILIVGGGATGLGCALDAASRGYRTALVEAHDFAKGTSSRSTKLIHGGVRYLRQGNVPLVREALHERGILLRNAPQLVHPLQFFVPSRNIAERLYYFAGLQVYDRLGGARDVPGSRMESGGCTYYDAQFDDARLAIALACTASGAGAAVSNYVTAKSLAYKNGRIGGLQVEEGEAGARFPVAARAVINATGIFADDLRRLDDPNALPLLRLSRGTHIVLPAEHFARSDRALLVPSTPDGRVLFAIPWQGRMLVGTTDVAAARSSIEPETPLEDVDWLLSAITPYAATTPRRSDVTSAFTGLRPLLRAPEAATSKLSREHAIEVSASGLVTIAGGKWTTYRRMAQDAVDAAAQCAGLPAAACRTESLSLQNIPVAASFERSARDEMARTVEDLLARRTRTLFVDAREAIEQAPKAARVLAKELGRDEEWRFDQIERFSALAARYRTE